jgi:hypothetical protein
LQRGSFICDACVRLMYLVKTADAIALVDLADAVEETSELALVSLSDISSEPVEYKSDGVSRCTRGVRYTTHIFRAVFAHYLIFFECDTQGEDEARVRTP